MKGKIVDRAKPEPAREGTEFRERQNSGGKLMKEAMQLARDPKRLEKERSKLCQGFSSCSSRRAKEVKRQEVMTLAAKVSESGRPLPLSIQTVERVAAALKAAGFKSGPQYLGELRLAHVEAGYEVGSWLSRSLRLCKKALERDSGPTRRAPEVKAEQISTLKAKVGAGSRKMLEWPDLSYWWSMTWMLREIELRELRWKHVLIREDDKLVTLRICKSKVDQMGAGVRRTLTCCGKHTCEAVCAWKLARATHDEEAGR